MLSLANRFFLIIILVSNTQHAFAWNHTSHKIIANLTWQLLDPQYRIEISNLLLHHPRYQQDLLRYHAHRPQNVRNQWIFAEAAVWPDQIANKSSSLRKRYHHPNWHYINIPIFLDNQLVNIKNSSSNNTFLISSLNIVQALEYTAKQLQAEHVSKANQAISLCWMLHLIGDIHQPLHAAALFSPAHFPSGDRGGNLIRIQHPIGRANLHSFWDSVFSRVRSLDKIEKNAKHLMTENLNSTHIFDPQRWSEESNLLAKKYAYNDELSREIIAKHGSAKPIKLSANYIRQAKQIAGQQIQLAAYRTAFLLQQIYIRE